MRIPKVILYYIFTPLSDPAAIKIWQRNLCEGLNLKGRIIVSPHGINGTLGGDINDLKKYIKAPDLLSNLNLNTALETFLRWDINNVQFQAGPQLRYQLFSNVRGDYPIKEHLVDYGFRIGIVKTLR